MAAALETVTPSPPSWENAAAIVFAPAVGENRCVFRVINSADYHYVRTAHHVATELRLTPPAVHGLQTLQERKIHVAPLPHAVLEDTDSCGNGVIGVRHETIYEHLTIVMELRVATACRYTEAGAALPIVVSPRNSLDTERKLFTSETRRTLPSDALRRVADDLLRQNEVTGNPFGFVIALRQFIHREMTFVSGATGVSTTASEAWEVRRGVCQDYSHIAITLCRLCGLPARYVSGFVPGEGVMHAWVEVLLPVPDVLQPAEKTLSEAWFPLDPTYNKWVNERYIAVAVGRDYGDITPTSGTYFGGANELRHRSRASITAKETILL